MSGENLMIQNLMIQDSSAGKSKSGKVVPIFGDLGQILKSKVK